MLSIFQASFCAFPHQIFIFIIYTNGPCVQLSTFSPDHMVHQWNMSDFYLLKCSFPELETDLRAAVEYKSPPRLSVKNLDHFEQIAAISVPLTLINSRSAKVIFIHFVTLEFSLISNKQQQIHLFRVITGFRFFTFSFPSHVEHLVLPLATSCHTFEAH